MSFCSYILKYTFRSLHLLSFALIAGNMTYDNFFGKRSSHIEKSLTQKFNMSHVIFSVILMISGLINMIILVKENKYVKNVSYEVWKKLLIFKLILTLALTPVLELILGGNTETNFKTRFYIVTLAFLISPFLRYFRESMLIPSKHGKEQTENKKNIN